MMNRTLRLCAKLRPRRSTGGMFKLDPFELRAAAFAARITLKMGRFEAQTTRTSTPQVRKRQGMDLATVRNLAVKTKLCLRFLEQEMKRATRQFLKSATSGELKILSEEWRVHLRWMKYHLAYFKPFRPVGPGLRRLQRKRIDLLLAMAKKAMDSKKGRIPNDKLVRDVIRRFIRDCHRGRVGDRNFLYMLKNQESPIALAELLEYVAPRLGLGGIKMGKNRGRATWIAHRVAAEKPKAMALINEFSVNFEKWPTDVRKKKLSKLLAIDGISVRGLADDTGIKPSTLRHYIDLTPPAEQVKSPVTKSSPVQKAAVRRPSVAEPAQMVAATVTSPIKVVPPNRPQQMNRPSAPQPDCRERAELLIEFFKTRGSQLGLQYPSDLPLVLQDVERLMSDLPDSSGQATGTLPMGDARTAFFNGISLGAMDCDRKFQLATGLRNLMRALGGGKSMWDDALSELRRLNGELLGGPAREQASQSEVKPVQRPVAIGIAVPEWRRLRHTRSILP